MKFVLTKRVKFYLLVLFLLLLNFPVFMHVINNSNLYTTYQLSTSNTTTYKSPFPNYKSGNVTYTTQNSDLASYSITDKRTFNFTLNSSQSDYSIALNSTSSNSIGYVDINQSLSASFLSISLFNSLNQNVSNLLSYYSLNDSSPSTYAKISFSQPDSWYLFVNSTFNFSSNLNMIFNVRLTLFFPNQGFDFAHAISVYNFVSNTNPVNKTSLTYYAFFPYEVIFFKTTVESNRRVDISLKDTNTSSNILSSSYISFYQTDPGIFTPSFLGTPIKDLTGAYISTWVSNCIVKSNTLFIKVLLNYHPDNQTSSFQYSSPITGSFDISFSFESEGYSLDTAVNLVFNHFLTNHQNYSDQYVHLHTSFFKFNINRINTSINIFMNSSNSLVIANSQFVIFYESEGNPISQITIPTSGKANFSFLADKNGTYFIKYLPSFHPDQGLWSITIFSIDDSTPISRSNNLFGLFLFFSTLMIIVAISIVFIAEYNNYSKNKSKSSNKSFISFLKDKFQNFFKKDNQPPQLSDHIFDLLEEIEKENIPDK